MASAEFPEAPGQSSFGEKETFLYLEELDSLLQELQSCIPGEAARDSWGLGTPGLAALQRDALRGVGWGRRTPPPAGVFSEGPLRRWPQW